MEAATTQKPETEHAVSSFAKSLFLGEIHEEMVFPFPMPDPEEQERIRALCQAAREIPYDATPVRGGPLDRRRHVAAFGEAGLCGLYVPEEYGGQGLSQTGYCRVSEVFAQIDATLSVIMGVHQSIGMKGIVLFGTDDQKARFLPDLATRPQARRLRPHRARGGLRRARHAVARREAGGRLVAAQRREALHRQRLEGRGVRDLRRHRRPPHRLHPREGDGRLRGRASASTRWACAPTICGASITRTSASRPENVLGEPGDGFKIAMQILNTGRLSLGTGSVGGAKRLLDLTIDHVKERKQFGRPLADFELVQDKVGWMVSYLFGLESMAYLTTGLVDMGVPDYSLESAICKVSGTEFLWYAANRAMQLKGGAGYMRDEPYEKSLRDIRIFPIFEGANDVMRAYIALTGMKPLGEELKELGDINLGDPIGSLGVLADYVTGRVKREVRPDRVTKAHDALERPGRPGGRPGQAAALGHRGAAPRAQARGDRAPVPPEAPGRRRGGHLRAGRRALARHEPPRGARSRALGPGALHRRDLLHARGLAGRRSRSTRSSRTTTSA